MPDVPLSYEVALSLGLSVPKRSSTVVNEAEYAKHERSGLMSYLPGRKSRRKASSLDPVRGDDGTSCDLIRCPQWFKASFQFDIVTAHKRPSTDIQLSNIKLANAPFDGSDDLPRADIVLTSSDDVQFYVHTFILSVASPEFRNLFNKLGEECIVDGNKTDIPSEPRSVPIEARSATLDCFLRLIYPLEKPIISDISLAVDVWTLSQKYSTAVVKKSMMDTIHSLPISDGNELDLFAAAYKVQDEELANRAVHSWVATTWKNVSPAKLALLDHIKQCNFVYVAGMADIPAGVYHRLLRFVASSNGQPAQNFCIFATRHVAACGSPRDEGSVETANSTNSVYPSMVPPDVIIRSGEGVDIPAHKLLLQLAGATSLMVDQDPIIYKRKLPVYQTRLPFRQLQQLIDLCYPPTTRNHRGIPLSDIVDLVHASREPSHRLPEHETLLKQRLCTFIVDEPLRTYFAADQLGWSDIAEQAARRTIALDFDQLYTPEMEHVSAFSYYKLLRFHHQCQLAVMSTDASSASGDDSGEAEQMSMSSLIGISAPFGPIPISLAARYQLHASETGLHDTPDHESCEAMERKLEQLSDEVLERKAEIERILGNVSIRRPWARIKEWQ